MISGSKHTVTHAQRAISNSVSSWVGHHLSIASVGLLTFGWTAYGVSIGFTREWFLISNMAGTLVTFLILLLVQQARNRHTLAIQAKVDQLIYSSEAANHWIGAERHAPETVEEMRVRHHSAR